MRMDTPANSTSEVLRLHRREEGYRSLLLRLFVLLKTAQVGDQDEERFEGALQSFLTPLLMMLKTEGSLIIGERDGYLYLNGVRARVDLEGFAALKFLVQALLSRDLSGILFMVGVSEEELVRFLETFLRPDGGPSGHAFLEEVESRGILHIQPILRPEIDIVSALDPHGEEQQRSAPTQKTYFKSVFLLKILLEGVSLSSCVGIREAKQILLDLVDHLLEKDVLLIAIDGLREHAPEKFLHSINVAILATELGGQVLLDPDDLRDLGAAALVHECGRVEALAPLPVDAPHGYYEAAYRLLARGAHGSEDVLRIARIVREIPGSSPTASLVLQTLRLADRFERFLTRARSFDLDMSTILDRFRSQGTDRILLDALCATVRSFRPESSRVVAAVR